MFFEKVLLYMGKMLQTTLEGVARHGMGKGKRQESQGEGTVWLSLAMEVKAAYIIDPGLF